MNFHQWKNGCIPVLYVLRNYDIYKYCIESITKGERSVRGKILRISGIWLNWLCDHPESDQRIPFHRWIKEANWELSQIFPKKMDGWMEKEWERLNPSRLESYIAIFRVQRKKTPFVRGVFDREVSRGMSELQAIHASPFNALSSSGFVLRNPPLL